MSIMGSGGGGQSEAQVDARVVAVASGIQTEQFRPLDWRVSSTEATRGYAGPAAATAYLDTIETTGSGTGYHWVQMPWQFPQKWDGGQIRFRMLWGPSTTNTGDIIFGLLFTAVNEGDPFGTITLSNNGPTTTDTALGTVDDFQRTPWSAWTSIDAPGNLGYVMRLQGNASSGSYTFTGTVKQMLVEMQWQSSAPTDD